MIIVFKGSAPVPISKGEEKINYVTSVNFSLSLNSSGASNKSGVLC